jgi:hypothetical protein
MLNEFVFFIRIDAIRAFLKRAVIACVLNFLYVFLSHSEAVDALGIGSMIAVTLFNFFLRERLRLL